MEHVWYHPTMQMTMTSEGDAVDEDAWIASMNTAHDAMAQRGATLFLSFATSRMLNPQEIGEVMKQFALDNDFRVVRVVLHVVESTQGMTDRGWDDIDKKGYRDAKMKEESVALYKVRPTTTVRQFVKSVFEDAKKEEWFKRVPEHYEGLLRRNPDIEFDWWSDENDSATVEIGPVEPASDASEDPWLWDGWWNRDLAGKTVYAAMDEPRKRKRAEEEEEDGDDDLFF